MDDFNKKRKDFLQLIKPLFESEFLNSQNKSPFLTKWKQIINNSDFCKYKFSYKNSDYNFDEDEAEEEFHKSFQFTKNFNYIDCTRQTNPDCLSGDLTFSFGEGSSGTQLFYIHTNSTNMVISHDDDIYLSDDIDLEILAKIKRSDTSFYNFINILKPQITNTILMSKDNYSKWLQIERDNLFIRYTCNITTNDEWDFGDIAFQDLDKANEFYFSFIEKYAKNNKLELSSCSEDVKFDIEKLIYKYS